jgi:LCP family protein required for cell wall assembly
MGTATDTDREPAPSDGGETAPDGGETAPDGGKPSLRTAIACRLGHVRTAIGPRLGRLRTVVACRLSRVRTAIGPRFSRLRTAIARRLGHVRTAIGPRFSRLRTAIARRLSRVRAVIACRLGHVRPVESPLAASLRSALRAGLGHLVMGRGRWAALFLVPSVLGLGWIAIELSKGLDWFGLSLFDDTFVATLIAIVALLAIWRIVAVGHAFLTAPGRPRWRKLETALTAMLALSILAAHTAVIAGAWAVYQTGVAVNANDMLSDSSLAGESPAAPTETPSPVPLVLQETYAPTAGPTPAPTRWENPDRITFLLIGIDFMTGRRHASTDTMMLATLDVHTNIATIISVPRDTANFELYYGGWVAPTFKLNGLMSAASSSSFGSPDSAVTTLTKEVGFLLGLPIDYYAAVDLEGFVEVVEALGGVDVEVKTPLNDPYTGTFVPAGLIHMDGHLALKYARSRMSTSDWARQRRQQDVLIALARKVVTPAVVPHLPDLFSIAGKTIATDFPMKYWRNFVTAFRRVKTPIQCILSWPYSYHPDSSTTGGTWTSRLDIDKVAGLSVYLFGTESTYYNRPGVIPAPCST